MAPGGAQEGHPERGHLQPLHSQPPPQGVTGSLVAPYLRSPFCPMLTPGVWDKGSSWVSTASSVMSPSDPVSQLSVFQLRERAGCRGQRGADLWEDVELPLPRPGCAATARTGPGSTNAQRQLCSPHSQQLLLQTPPPSQNSAFQSLSSDRKGFARALRGHRPWVPSAPFLLATSADFQESPPSCNH